MSEMLERAGRAACIASGREPENWLNPHDKELCMRIATAVVRALREADNDMLQAMHEAMFVDEFTGADLPMLGAGFAAAIDSILSTQPQEEK